jgi:hypothetical protein
LSVDCSDRKLDRRARKLDWVQVDRPTCEVVIVKHYARIKGHIGISPVPLPIAEIAQDVDGLAQVSVVEDQIEIAMDSCALSD